jgi:hypothetical protein
MAKMINLLELSQPVGTRLSEPKAEKADLLVSGSSSSSASSSPGNDKVDLLEKLIADMKMNKAHGTSSSSSSSSAPSSASNKSREAKERALLALKKMEDVADDHKDPDYQLLEDALPDDTSDDERDGHSRVVDGTEPMAPVVHAAVTEKFGSWRKLVEKMKSIKSTHYKHELERLAGIIDAMEEDDNISVKSEVFERTVRSFIAVQALSNGNHPDFVAPLFTSLDGERSTDVLNYVPGWGSFLRSQLMLTLKLKKLNQEVNKGGKSGDSENNGGSEWYGQGKKKKPNRRPKKGKKQSDDSAKPSGSSGKGELKRSGEAKGNSSAARKP